MPRLRTLTLAGALCLGACAQTFDAARLGVSTTLASPIDSAVPGTSFRINTHHIFLLWGAATLTAPSLQKSLAGQLVGGKGLADVKIRVHSGFWDVVFTGLTLGLVVPRSVTFEGVVVGGDSVTAKPAPPPQP